MIIGVKSSKKRNNLKLRDFNYDKQQRIYVLNDKDKKHENEAHVATSEQTID